MANVLWENYSTAPGQEPNMGTFQVWLDDHAEIPASAYPIRRDWAIYLQKVYDQERYDKFRARTLYERLIIQPKVGMHITLFVGSDRYPYEVVGVKGVNQIYVYPLLVKWVDGSQVFESNPHRDEDSQPALLSRRQDGYWYEKGAEAGGACYGRLGLQALSYLDPSF